jgi:DNA-binding beta-propeller fold protein YncE
MSKLYNSLIVARVSYFRMKRKRGQASTISSYYRRKRSNPFGVSHLIVRHIGVYQICAMATAVACAVGGQGAEAEWMGPAAAAGSANARTLWLACERSRQVVSVDLATKSVTRSLGLEEHPTGLVLSQTSHRLIVTCSGASNCIVSLEPETSRVLASWAAGSGVCSPVLSRDGRGLYVCNRYDNSVWLLRPDSGRVLARTEVQREPVSASLSSDGKYLAVANLLPTGPANQPVVRAAVSLLDARKLKLLRTVCLPNGSTSVRAVAFHPERRVCAVVHNLAHFQGAATQVEHGWMNASALTLVWIDEPGARTVTVVLDEARRGAANPSSVAWSPDGLQLCIAHAGTHELSLIDFKALEQSLSGMPDGKVVGDFGFLQGIRDRIALGGNGPRAVVVVRGAAYVAEFFSDSVATVDLTTRSLGSAISLSAAAPTGPEREGERLFHDASICHQGWQSCASCHPEGRVDGLNWDLLNDGPGNPKNTKSLLLCSQTPPAMCLGIRETAEQAVRSGFRHILFAKRPEPEAVAIDAYLRSLQPMPSPRLVNGNLSRSALRGKALFESARTGCFTCHPPGLFTDLRSYDVGTRGSYDKAGDKFDTPTLVELWRTAPYLHDGSAATIREVLTTRKPHDQHGRTSSLSRRQIEDLCAYLLSL